MATVNENREIFKNLTSKISHLFIERSKGDWKIISKTLDDLNSLNYRYSLVENPIKAVLLINHCCSYIPADEEILIPKCCRLITNLVNLQKVTVEGRTHTIAIHWCLQVLNNFKEQQNISLEVLVALDALLRNNSLLIGNEIVDILSSNGPIIKLLEMEVSLEIVRYCLQCIESCIALRNDEDSIDSEKLLPYFDKCFTIFTKYLLVSSISDTLGLKIIIICLRGLENTVNHHNNLTDKLGLILGIIKSYMLVGIKNKDFSKPQSLLPSPLSIPDPPINGIRKKGGKVIRQRKHKISKKEESRKSEDWMSGSPNINCLSSKSFDCSIDTSSLLVPLPQLVTSDSDFSDTETNKGANILRLQTRVRQVALSLFFTIAKNSDPRIMFAYWSSFIPENSLLGKHYLTTCILEDPSPKGRMAALNVLLFLLTSSKSYLSQAESSVRSTSFTPFSVMLGYMIIELHRHLSLALSEKVTHVLAQVLKCYAALVQASPYHKLNPGLITKVVRSMKHFIQYKDSSIQVGTLIVLSCILASEPVVPEAKSVFMTNIDEKDIDDKKEGGKSVCSENFLYAEFSSDEEEDTNSLNNKTSPWILEKCLTNLQVNSAENISELMPAPVKVESLQVISSMCRNYFDCLIYPHLVQIGKTLNDCLSDKNIDLKLHTGKCIDFIGQFLEQYISGLGSCDDEKISAGLIFWHSLLNGALTLLLQSEQQPTLKAVGCDCLGSIGSTVFERLPSDKQILCVTLLFACSRDEEHIVRAAALRALGISVLYTILREDAGFVVDTAEAVYRSLQDENMAVRIKGSWSLGNLSDALVLNSSNEKLEELPDSLLLKLLDRCVTSAVDNDKIKMNIVRTIGNLLQLVTEDQMVSVKFKEIVKSSIRCVLRTSTTGSNMKVRWNSCYAIGNLLKNSALYINSAEWLGDVFNTLNQLVINFRNFKVRINAALALSSPPKRKYYGGYYHSIWASLLKALENSQNIDDYSEYQHRDNLIEQVCLTLSRIISVSEKDDLPELHENLKLYIDLLKFQIKRVNEILIPEKSSIIYRAAVHLKSFSDSTLNGEAKKALLILKDIFVSEF